MDLDTRADQIVRKFIQAAKDEQEDDIMLAATLMLSIFLGRYDQLCITRIDETIDAIAIDLKQLVRIRRALRQHNAAITAAL